MFGSLAILRRSVVLAAVVAAGRLHAAEADGVLVLRNGSILTGRIHATTDHYRVESGGASLQIPAAQVDMACRTLDEAYRRRRDERTGPTADSHLQLARWCLRQDLLDQAALELAAARAIDPAHLDLAPLDSQLVQIRQARAARSGPLAARPPQPEPVAEAMPFEAPIAARARFARSIQPMLIHTCTAGGCHLPATARPFQLNRWALDGNGNPTFVRRNLAAVAARMSTSDPEASELVRYARREHGGGPLGPSRPLEPFQVEMLLAWMNEALGIAPPVVDPAAMASGQPLPQAAAGAGTAGADLPASSAPIAGTSAPPAPLAPTGAAPGEPTPDAAAAFVPRDAFDGEIFNRRMASRRAE